MGGGRGEGGGGRRWLGWMRFRGGGGDRKGRGGALSFSILGGGQRGLGGGSLKEGALGAPPLTSHQSILFFTVPQLINTPLSPETGQESVFKEDLLKKKRSFFPCSLPPECQQNTPPT